MTCKDDSNLLKYPIRDGHDQLFDFDIYKNFILIVMIIFIKKTDK